MEDNRILTTQRGSFKGSHGSHVGRKEPYKGLYYFQKPSMSGLGTGP